MRKNFGPKPYTYPQPVFIVATYDENGTPDAMNVAWGGISEENEISMCLSANHKTVKNILLKRAFTVSMADAAHVAECDYVGIVSANRVPDKLHMPLGGRDSKCQCRRISDRSERQDRSFQARSHNIRSHKQHVYKARG